MVRPPGVADDLWFNARPFPVTPWPRVRPAAADDDGARPVADVVAQCADRLGGEECRRRKRRKRRRLGVECLLGGWYHVLARGLMHANPPAAEP